MTDSETNGQWSEEELDQWFNDFGGHEAFLAEFTHTNPPIHGSPDKYFIKYSALSGNGDLEVAVFAYWRLVTAQDFWSLRPSEADVWPRLGHEAKERFRRGWESVHGDPQVDDSDSAASDLTAIVGSGMVPNYGAAEAPAVTYDPNPEDSAIPDLGGLDSPKAGPKQSTALRIPLLIAGGLIAVGAVVLVIQSGTSGSDTDDDVEITSVESDSDEDDQSAMAQGESEPTDDSDTSVGETVDLEESVAAADETALDESDTEVLMATPIDDPIGATTIAGALGYLGPDDTVLIALDFEVPWIPEPVPPDSHPFLSVMIGLEVDGRFRSASWSAQDGETYAQSITGSSTFPRIEQSPALEVGATGLYWDQVNGRFVMTIPGGPVPTPIELQTFTQNSEGPGTETTESASSYTIDQFEGLASLPSGWVEIPPDYGPVILVVPGETGS